MVDTNKEWNEMTQDERDEINRQEDERERYKSNFDDDDVLREPPPGTFAATARMMAQIMPDFDWDAWKDEMKEEM